MTNPTLDEAPGRAWRVAGAAAVAQGLDDARGTLLRLWAAWQRALPDRTMNVRYDPALNPPLWELGHVGWFEERWLARNPERWRGAAADPEAPRAASLRPGSDALYDSSAVAHARRWHLDLPDAACTLDDLRRIRQATLALLAGGPHGSDDDWLYFFRLATAHEDMHREAWVYMAQHLGIDLEGCGVPLAPPPLAGGGEIAFDAGRVCVGSSGGGFAFDNELPAHEVDLPAFAIDAAPLTWTRFLPFVDAGGYDEPRWWDDEGAAWRRRQARALPRALRREDGAWLVERFGRLVPLRPDEPVMHVTRHEAAAWCRWAGRRLPAEAEWECAATSGRPEFAWGNVWEWTASAFAPHPGFAPHPYRDYSRPWFDGRPVLRGASFATSPRLRCARYRNYFPADRNDLFAGFRSCAA